MHSTAEAGAGVSETEAANVGAGDTAPAALPTAGWRLRQARESAGLGVENVAQSLKFSARQVEALEADNHEALPGTTVVRGFTRSYARLLGLDADEVLGLLDAQAPSRPIDVRPPDNMGLASEPGGLRQLSFFVSAAIVIALAAVFISLWQFLSPTLNAPTTSAVATVPAAAPVAAGTSEPLPAAVPGAVAVPAPGSMPEQPQGTTLQFAFDERSWLEVKDAAGQILHTGENPAGTQITLAGTPPYDIVIGNAARVRLKYGDRDIDLAPHTRAEVARLKLE